MSRPANFTPALIAALRATDVTVCARTFCTLMSDAMRSLDVVKMAFASAELFRLFAEESTTLNENFQIEALKEHLFTVKDAQAQLALLVQGVLLPAMQAESAPLISECVNDIATHFLPDLVEKDLSKNLRKFLEYTLTKKPLTAGIKAKIASGSDAVKQLVMIFAVVNKRLDIVDELFATVGTLNDTVLNSVMLLLVQAKNPESGEMIRSLEDFSSLLSCFEGHALKHDSVTKQHLRHIAAVLIDYGPEASDRLMAFSHKHKIFSGETTARLDTDEISQLVNLLKYACGCGNMHAYFNLFERFQFAVAGDSDKDKILAKTTADCLKVAYEARDFALVNRMVQRFGANEAVIAHLGDAQDEEPSELYTLVSQASTQLRRRQGSLLVTAGAVVTARNKATKWVGEFRARKVAAAGAALASVAEDGAATTTESKYGK
ncbi:MAG: hypothetical protein P1U34_01540 [Coxiellaceae bacterium]|nr:hypothetical protein [Coxiellaceae bacterium]